MVNNRNIKKSDLEKMSVKELRDLDKSLSQQPRKQMSGLGERQQLQEQMSGLSGRQQEQNNEKQILIDDILKLQSK